MQVHVELVYESCCKRKHVHGFQENMSSGFKPATETNFICIETRTIILYRQQTTKVLKIQCICTADQCLSFQYENSRYHDMSFNVQFDSFTEILMS